MEGVTCAICLKIKGACMLDKEKCAIVQKLHVVHTYAWQCVLDALLFSLCRRCRTAVGRLFCEGSRRYGIELSDHSLSFCAFLLVLCTELSRTDMKLAAFRAHVIRNIINLSGLLLVTEHVIGHKWIHLCSLTFQESRTRSYVCSGARGPFIADFRYICG